MAGPYLGSRLYVQGSRHSVFPLPRADSVIRIHFRDVAVHLVGNCGKSVESEFRGSVMMESAYRIRHNTLRLGEGAPRVLRGLVCTPVAERGFRAYRGMKFRHTSSDCGVVHSA